MARFAELSRPGSRALEAVRWMTDEQRGPVRARWKSVPVDRFVGEDIEKGPTRSETVAEGTGG
ncbi:hypothetical protein DFR70_10445 [Nocardia tenerifensis]|uniref:Uncharacterized protein n=1 Tax=Nocardia tenerifensis TaxID=228006 RepID=A0A318K0C8_9NOCA|nr:hypothetical protein [Nocardia tenerifensis]PXX64984.1 hypothetical protein DFR70_10445 [Nocardia tenerifensis]